MKKFTGKNLINLVLIALFTVFTVGSFLIDFKTGEAIFRESFSPFVKEMIMFLPLMFILIGLGDV